MTVQADIFIPTSKSPVSLDHCLQSLARQTNKQFRVILVSLDQSAALKKLIKKDSRLKIKHLIQKKKGLVSAANLALHYADKKIFIRIDDDVTATRGWFENILKTFKEDAEIGCVTGPTWLTKKGLRSRDSIVFLKPSSKKNIFAALANHFIQNYLYEGRLYAVGLFFKSGNFSIGSNFKKYSKQKKEVMNVEACNFAIRTSLLKSIGGFDTIYARGLGEYHEADAAFKVREKGYRIIFNPRAAVTHHIETDSPETRPDAYHRIGNFIYFYKRHIGIKNADHLLRFFSNIFMQDIYYLYKFLKTRDSSQLGALPGSFAALFKNI